MAPRPPAPPHFPFNPSAHFSQSADWAEEDAWDSASDSESPRRSNFWAHSAPKPVPISSDNNSSPSLAFSYTHINAPDPSSYPSHSEEPIQASKNGWTIVRKTQPGKRSSSVTRNTDNDEASHDIDVDGDMVVGELDSELTSPDQVPHPITSHSKSRLDNAYIREDVEDIINDPLNGVKYRPRHRDTSPTASRRHRGASSKDVEHHSPERSEKLLRERSIRTNRRYKFVDCLSSQDVNPVELRKLAWSGIPPDFRPMAWQLLLGYLPLPTPLRSSTLARKREEYLSLVQVAFARDREGLDQQIWHQIEIDVPRTRPGVRLWMFAATQRSLERILYVWALRHPASGYVQGINDLVTPFFQVFLSAYIDSDPEIFDPALLPKNVLDAIEADSFWCLSRLLDGIQDNYISQQPGIQRSVRRMAELVARIDAPLYAHLESQNVEFMQFAFRWMNCLLMREISVQNTIRMWDTYLAEGADAFSQFHLYVCSAFLVKWSEKLRQMDFQGIIMFLQSLPTQDWGDHEIEMLLSEAFVLNSIWHNAQSHFNGK
ncbi:hypothetical protein AMATHDRAFT_77552 [Amanita thiersii Skay4041]|uniref:Rab-GAP TBC domain-containing protein n=1 Tax=Amanita thiersii Skay4041 TaxID=703135 RepID=A0A2A9N8L0_9AGAR|nr:hypothetical protein AMATHDRAFT_77552 [Amanita thiersii Skay4041]